MKTALRWFNHGTEAVAAAMLAAMFCTFILQIFSRYVMGAPFGWTLELCLALWIWLVFWGNAFIVHDRDHVTFDLLYLALPRGPRRWLSIIAALAIAGAMIVSIYPTWDYIDFLRIKRSATLRVPMKDIYIIYMLFLGVVALRYLWRAVEVWRNGLPADDHALVDGDAK